MTNAGKMRKRISITLSSDILVDIDRERDPKVSRSAFIERVLRDYFKNKEREMLNQRDLVLINANADSLNREAEDVLRYQAPIGFSSEEP